MYPHKANIGLCACLLPLLLVLGCQTMSESMPKPRGFSQADADKTGAAIAAKPTGRDLDQEGLQV